MTKYFSLKYIHAFASSDASRIQILLLFLYNQAACNSWFHTDSLQLVLIFIASMPTDLLTISFSFSRQNEE